MFDQDFYDDFADQGLEKRLSVTRNGEIIRKDYRGIISNDHVLFLPPDQDMVLKVNDLVSDGYNEYIVLSIHDSGGSGTVWQLQIERHSDYLRKQQTNGPKVTNNVSANNFAQNVGDNGSINFSQYSYSINDLNDQLLSIEQADRKLFVELLGEIQTMNEPKKLKEKGFLKRFDNLIGKYPNVSKIVAGLLFGWATGSLK